MDETQLLLLLQKRRQEISAGLCESPVATFDEYMKHIGAYGGVGEAITIIKNASKEEDTDA